VQNLATAGLVGLVDLPDAAQVHSPPISAGWVTGAFNHLALRWNHAAPRISFSLNGGSPSTTTTEWTPSEANVAYLRLNSGGSTSMSIFDDWAVWKRELSDAELAAIYTSTVPLGTACGL
jgi:hypothetical protein